QHPSIVVVEDDAGMSKAIARLLRAAGFQTKSFASAEEFLQTDAASEADCLVLDVHLPGISGFDLRRRLAALGQNMPVIFITAQDEDSVRAEAEQLDCIAYFRKPFQGSELLGAIREALNLAPKH
ncbi:MAG: response regulator transcription factor, partial [Candidatus Binatia bacterium]